MALHQNKGSEYIGGKISDILIDIGNRDEEESKEDGENDDEMKDQEGEEISCGGCGGGGGDDNEESKITSDEESDNDREENNRDIESENLEPRNNARNNADVKIVCENCYQEEDNTNSLLVVYIFKNNLFCSVQIKVTHFKNKNNETSLTHFILSVNLLKWYFGKTEFNNKFV